MPKQFPKEITIKPDADDPHKIFYGDISFSNSVIEFIHRGLREKDIFDLVIEIPEVTKKSTFHHYYGVNGHLTTFDYKCKMLEATIEVKHWGTHIKGGQIEHVIIKITKCEVPKVTFTLCGEDL